MMKLPEPNKSVLAFVQYKSSNWYEVLSHDGEQWIPNNEHNEEFYKDPRVIVRGWEYCEKHIESMTAEELADRFIRQFDKLANDNKNDCLNEIAEIMSTKYDILLNVEIEVSDEHEEVTNGYADEHCLPLSATKITFTWDV